MGKYSGCVAAAVLVCATAVQAAPVTFGFTGSITQVGLDELGTGVAFGDGFSGQYTFDDAAVDAIADTAQGSYSAFGGGYGLSVDIGSSSFAVSGYLNVGTGNGLPADQYTVFASDGVFDIGLFFQDVDGGSFADDGLPLLPFSLAGFETRDFYLRDTAGSVLDLGGEITALTCLSGCGPTPMPEPGSLWLAGLALATAAGCGRRRA